jgi:hypothetical protein
MLDVINIHKEAQIREQLRGELGSLIQFTLGLGPLFVYFYVLFELMHLLTSGSTTRSYVLKIRYDI